MSLLDVCPQYSISLSFQVRWIEAESTDLTCCSVVFHMPLCLLESKYNNTYNVDLSCFSNVVFCSIIFMADLRIMVILPSDFQLLLMAKLTSFYVYYYFYG